MTPIFRGQVVRGELAVHNLKSFQAYLQKLEGQKVHILVKKPRPARSKNQNSYYWGVVVELIAETTGYTPAEAHEALKWKFLLKREGKLPIAGTTSDMDTIEFEEYLANVRAWASSELNCFIPLPNEVDA
jgi:hypothetical protein